MFRFRAFKASFEVRACVSVVLTTRGALCSLNVSSTALRADVGSDFDPCSPLRFATSVFRVQSASVLSGSIDLFDPRLIRPALILFLIAAPETPRSQPHARTDTPMTIRFREFRGTREHYDNCKYPLLLPQEDPIFCLQSSFWPAFIYPLGSERLCLKSPKIARLFDTRPICARSFFMEAKMAIGIVKWFNPSKGFGFIQPDNGSQDVFVHVSAVDRAGLGTLNEGQRISYNVVSERGKQAADDIKLA
jgi:CspA family cold shock protein